MTQSEAKRAFERRIAEVVGREVGATDVVPGDRPDAVLTVGGRAIGLEIVSLMANDWVQATEMMRELLKPEIERELSGRDLNYCVKFEIEVPEHFPPSGVQRSKAARNERTEWRRTLPKKIADLAALGSIDLNREQLRERGIAKLVRLTIEPRAEGPLALPGYWWSSPKPQTLAEELLQLKDDKLTGYRQSNPHLAEFWLALGPFGPGTMEDGFGWLMDGQYITEFARVFLVDPDNGKAYDVSPK